MPPRHLCTALGTDLHHGLTHQCTYTHATAVPAQSAFLNLDVNFNPDAVLTPLVSHPSGAGKEGEEDAGPARRLRGRISKSSSSSANANATATTAGITSNNPIDAEEQRKRAEEARDRMGLVLTARLEVPLPDRSGWRVLHQGPPVRRVLDAPSIDSSDPSSPSPTPHRRLLLLSPPLPPSLSSFAKKQKDDDAAAAAALPASVRRTPTGFRLLAVLFDTPGMERGSPLYRCVRSYTHAFCSCTCAEPHTSFPRKKNLH